MIAGSIGHLPDPVERDKLDKHCAECQSCREYREQLLKDDCHLAELISDQGQSLRDVEQLTLDTISTVTPIRKRHGRFTGTFSRIPRIAAVAAAVAMVILVLVTIDLIHGAFDGSVPAFAAVQEKMQKFDNVVRRERTWGLGQWTTCVHGMTRSWLQRWEYNDSTIVRDKRNFPGERVLRMYPAEKRAVISETTYIRREGHPEKGAVNERESPNVNRLAELYKGKDFSFVRKERYDGKSTAVYVWESGPSKVPKWTVWVDLHTELPIRIEVVAGRSGPSQPFGLRLSDFVAPGSEAAGWADLKTDEPSMIWDDFRWNAPVDSSYFSLVPPAGYSVETLTKVWDSRKPSRGRGYEASTSIVALLSSWLSLSGNVFPDEINDLFDSTKFKRLLLAKYRRGGDPVEEFRAAHRCASAVQEDYFYAIGFLEFLKKGHIPLHYSGKGVSFGDSKKIICWLKIPENVSHEHESFCSIYADLHIATSSAAPKPTRRGSHSEDTLQ
jgi:hypothetical protein